MSEFEQAVRELLETTNTIASVGLSSNPEKDSHWVVKYLKEKGYKIIPVNPTASEIMGEKAYPSLSDIPDKVDVVQIFRKSEDVPPVVEEAIKIGARAVWMQEGIVNEEAGQAAQDAGLFLVMDTCMRAAHQWLKIGQKPIAL
ncbi:MAG TPA: CoA-binding protein [Anaerolineales bacterium]